MTWESWHWTETRIPQKWRQAQCSGCKALSAPRPVGETPENWGRDLGGQGRYWCPECVREGRS